MWKARKKRKNIYDFFRPLPFYVLYNSLRTELFIYLFFNFKMKAVKKMTSRKKSKLNCAK